MWKIKAKHILKGLVFLLCHGHVTAHSVELGMAITPRNFPNHTAADFQQAFKLSKQLADNAVFIMQWGRLNMDAARLTQDMARREGLGLIIGLSPTTLDHMRKELDVPAAVRKAAANNLSFANPVVRRAYIRDVERIAAMKPEYFCLATEINFLAFGRIEEYVHFASLYKEAYLAVKRISPKTRVFVSFQWEWMRILDAREPHRIKEHRKLVDIFRPQLDVVGLTTYPTAFHKSPADLVPDYYSWINQHINDNDEVLLMEVGWPTRGSGSKREQADYIGRLPELLKDVNVSILAWALLHDVNLAEFDANLNTTGLLSNTGQQKPGYNAFRKLKSLEIP